MIYRNSLYPARPSFKSNRESCDAGDYIQRKSASTSFCKSVCPTGKLIGANYNQFYAIRTSSLIKRNIYNATFNNNDLNINLFTKLDLKNVTVIDNKGIIDPSGVLFGNTECGMNNFENFIVPYYPCSSYNKSIDNNNSNNSSNDYNNSNDNNNDNNNNKLKITSNDLESNLFLAGKPTCDTAELNSSNNQIANTFFVKENINNLREEIINDLSNIDLSGGNNSLFIHLNQENTTSEYYTLSKNLNFIVEIPLILYLPQDSVEGNSFSIQNKSGQPILIQSLNNDLIYNNFYTASSGNKEIYLNNNFSSKFVYINNVITTISSWNVSIN